jgi:predicted nuclease of restriction endonuclease-like (RecB) superfamily
MNSEIKKSTQPVIFHTDAEYKTFLTEIKEKVRTSRLQAALSVNRELIALYWHIGKRIIEKEAETSWGDKLIEILSNDLQNTFPETRGFSTRNIKYMRQFAVNYPNEIGQQPVAQLPWGHIILLIQRVKNTRQREWYISQTIDHGWSRYTLERHVKHDLFNAQAIDENKASNFLDRLPEPQSFLAQDLLKAPYNFDFMGLHDDAHERDIEHSSLKHIATFLLELGRGFAFVGNQVPIVIDDEEFFIDILLYNLKLRCYTIVNSRVQNSNQHI